MQGESEQIEEACYESCDENEDKLAENVSFEDSEIRKLEPSEFETIELELRKWDQYIQFNQLEKMKEILEQEMKEEEEEENEDNEIEEEIRKLYEADTEDLQNSQEISQLSQELSELQPQTNEFQYRKYQTLLQKKANQQEGQRSTNSNQLQEKPQKKDITFGPFQDQKSNSEEDLTRKEGWLQKNANSKFLSWQKRYAQVENRTFKYFHRESDKGIKPAGIINFDFISTIITIIGLENPTQFIIKPIEQSRVFHMKCQNTEELNEWCIALYHNIVTSKGYSNQLTQIQKQPNFWRFDRVSLWQFTKQAQSGDIILFRGKTRGVKLMRKLTRSNYDHVGVLIRDVRGKLFLFEATGAAGVDLLNWDYFMYRNWHKLYERLVIRHLHCNRDQNFHNTVQTFVHSVLGQKYKLTLGKLSRKKSLKKEEQGYFCSQLVATLYKKLGFLPQDISACQYWPGRFSSEKQLKMLNGASLSPEFLLSFEE